MMEPPTAEDLEAAEAEVMVDRTNYFWFDMSVPAGSTKTSLDAYGNVFRVQASGTSASIRISPAINASFDRVIKNTCADASGVNTDVSTSTRVTIFRGGAPVTASLSCPQTHPTLVWSTLSYTSMTTTALAPSPVRTGDTDRFSIAAPVSSGGSTAWISAFRPGVTFLAQSTATGADAPYVYNGSSTPLDVTFEYGLVCPRLGSVAPAFPFKTLTASFAPSTGGPVTLPSPLVCPTGFGPPVAVFLRRRFR
jgi:hypothetical protein